MLSRFKDEITAIEKCSDLDGVIKIIDKQVGSIGLNDKNYYVMPIGSPIVNGVTDLPIDELLSLFRDLCETVRVMHSRNISHRDIKPANILIINGKCVLSDFGLVEYPGKKDVTQFYKSVGPKWTIAPEMKRKASKSDGIKADIYSLAKTFWILISGESTGFDGQYSENQRNKMLNRFPETYLGPLEKLLRESTDEDPDKRPDITTFINGLDEWEVTLSDYSTKTSMQWEEIQKKLFPVSIPARAEWHNIDEIINTLKLVSFYRNMNHTFFPDSGGMDLIDTTQFLEAHFIQLDFSSSITPNDLHIIKPRRLLFESFPSDLSWSYFRLELEECSPIDADAIKELQLNGYDLLFEDVVRLSENNFLTIEKYRDHYRGHYIDRQMVPPVFRRWMKGNFVIFSKNSKYNKISATYDGRHNKFDADGFRKYISKLRNALESN